MRTKQIDTSTTSHQWTSYMQRTVIVMICVGVMSLSFTDFWELDRGTESVKVDAAFRNLSMCSASSLFQIDLEEVYSSPVPLAPELDVKWQTNLDITSKSAEAKKFFNQGLFNLYAFNHAEGDRAFKEAIRLDPECAMCHWGVALGLGPNINSGMRPSNNEDAYTYAQQALTLSEHATPKEKALIQALTTRYASEAPEDRSGLDSIYASEMRIVSQRYRDDMDVATLFVEALMDRMPWQYWLADGEPKLATREAMVVLGYIAEVEPDHPGANHLHIHLVEEVHPDLATLSADRLADQELTAGHLVHMPSHIYIRTGRYNDATVANQRAIQVDEEYLQRCKAQGIYPASYYPHNIHFLWFAASMEGRGEISMAAARKLIEKTPADKVSKYPSIERYLTMPYFSMVRFGKWQEALHEPAPKPELIYATTMWHYARGMAYAHTGKCKKAKEELRKVRLGSKHERIEETNTMSYPTIGLTSMASLILDAEIAGVEGRHEQKIELLQEAVAVQDGLVYEEPPFFYYPIRQSLGAAYLENQDAQTAEVVFREDLEKFPKNGWSLYGLHQSLLQQDKLKEADEVKGRFDAAWSYADTDLSVELM